MKGNIRLATIPGQNYDSWGHIANRLSVKLGVPRRPTKTIAERVALLESSPSATSDDCTILPDGRRLDSFDAVCEWLAEEEAARLRLYCRDD